ncbi:MAG: hypothetical protein ABI782_09180 [Anaerolineaceae bacterium]
MYEELARARANELRVAEHTISHRMRWAEVSTIERLEKALRVARGRFYSVAGPILKTN